MPVFLFLRNGARNLTNPPRGATRFLSFLRCITQKPKAGTDFPSGFGSRHFSTAINSSTLSANICTCSTFRRGSTGQTGDEVADDVADIRLVVRQRSAA